MRTSEQIDQVSDAMAKTQASMTPASKSTVNPFFRSKYSSLPQIWEAIKEPLTKNKLSVIQDLVTTEKGISVTTRVCHSSGQWIEFGPLEIPATKKDAQGLGSAASYGRRYALAAALGVVSDEEDDDGNAACAKPQEAAQAKKEILSQQMIDDLVTKLHPDDKAAAIAFCKKNFGSEDLRYLSKSSYDSMLKRAIEKLEAEAEDEG